MCYVSNYEKKWKILDNFLIKLKKKGVKIPLEIINDLRSAKTIIQVLKPNLKKTENISRIEEYMRKVETFAVYTSEKLGISDVEELLKKTTCMKQQEKTKHPKETQKFIHGVPKNNSWLLIKPSEELQVKLIKELVKKNQLGLKIEKNEDIIVFGKQNMIKSFVKDVTKLFNGIKDP
jgi:hypothetical protein